MADTADTQAANPDSGANQAGSLSVMEAAARFGEIVDEVDADGIATSRTKADAPEIDGNLFIDQNAIGLKPGDIVKVKVDEASDYDLWGHLIL